MDKSKRILLNDIKLHIFFGNLVVNVLNINYEPPDSGKYFNTHCHSSYELHFIPRGKGILRIGKVNYDISPGTLYLTGPDVYHEQISDNLEPMEEYCINLELKQTEKWHERDSHYPVQEILKLNEILINTTFWIGNDIYSSWLLIEKALEECQNPLLGYCRNVESLVTQLIINAARCFSGSEQINYNQSSNSSSEKRRRVMDSFFRNFSEPLKAYDLAALLDVSLRQLERLMHQYYGMTFKDKLVKTRLEIAKDLLENTKSTLEKISVKTGFASSSHFSRVFKEQCGITPSEYRKVKASSLIK